MSKDTNQTTTTDTDNTESIEIISTLLYKAISDKLIDQDKKRV